MILLPKKGVSVNTFISIISILHKDYKSIVASFGEFGIEVDEGAAKVAVIDLDFTALELHDAL